MQFGIHIIVNHLTLSPVEVGRAVEERGFDSLFLGEHTHIPVQRETAYIGIGDRSPPRPGESADELRKRRPDLRQNFWYLYDPFIALATAAAVTERIKLGTAICLIPERDPITLAQEIATLDQISNGRVIIGIGSGWNREEMANHGVAWKDRFKVTRERVEAMRALWTDDEAEFHGETADFDPSGATRSRSRRAARRSCSARTARGPSSASSATATAGSPTASPSATRRSSRKSPSCAASGPTRAAIRPRCTSA